MRVISGHQATKLPFITILLCNEIGVDQKLKDGVQTLEIQHKPDELRNISKQALENVR